MKSIIYLLAGCCLILFSCYKNNENSYGNIVYKLKFEATQSNALKSGKVFPKSGTADFLMSHSFWIAKSDSFSIEKRYHFFVADENYKKKST